MPEMYWRWFVVVDPYLLWEGNPNWVFRNILLLYIHDQYSTTLRTYWNAFFELSGSRNPGFGISAIQYGSISHWLDENRIFDFESRIEFRHYINFLDSVYMEFFEKKRKQEKDTKRRKKK